MNKPMTPARLRSLATAPDAPESTVTSYRRWLRVQYRRAFLTALGLWRQESGS